MADSIKGITVEIGGDTLSLQNALKDVNSQSRGLQSELKHVERLLKFDPGNVELLAQRETLLNEQIQNTQEKLTRLRQVQQQVQQQFERGELGADQYRRFQREIISTEQRLQRLQGDFQETEQAAERSGSGIKEALGGALAGAVAGYGLQTVLEKSMEQADLNTTVKVSFNVPEEAVGKVENMIQSVKNFGVDSEAAISGVRKQLALNLQLTDEQNQKILDYAALIARAYSDIDFNELIQESNEFAQAIGVTQDEALAMTKTLLDAGFPPDQLDIMSEYGSQLKRAGYNALEIQGIFRAGIETKSWNIDVLLDGVKEGRIRLAEFGQGVDKTTLSMIKGTNISAKELQKWGAAVAEGGEAGKIAFGEVATELGKVSNENDRNAIGTRLFGTLWEEQGKKITDALAGANGKAITMKQNTDAMNKALAAMKTDPQYRLNEALGQIQEKLRPLLADIAEFVAKIADWAAKNPGLAAGITAVAVAIGIIMATMAALAPILTAIVALAGALGLEITAITLPIAAVVAAIVALIAIGVLLYKNWDTIKAKAAADWNDLTTKASEMGTKIKTKWNQDIADWKKMWSDMGARIRSKFNEDVEDIKRIGRKIGDFFRSIDLKKVGADIMNGLKNGIASAAKGIYNKANEIAGKVVSTIKKAFRTGSPSKVTHEIGLDVGAGLENGIAESIHPLRMTSIDMANAVIKQLDAMFNDKYNVVTAYFEAIQEDGDYLNDMLVHMPKQVADIARQVGKALAPDLEGTRKQDFQKDWDGNNKYIYVSNNINSPKALDTREITKETNRTLSRLAMYW